MTSNHSPSHCFASGVMFCLMLLGIHGCHKNRHMVLAATGTNIGVEISQHPATQSPQAKLGYQRTELGIVPTNRSTEDTATSENSMRKGAKDVAEPHKYSVWHVHSSNQGSGLEFL